MSATPSPGRSIRETAASTLADITRVKAAQVNGTDTGIIAANGDLNINHQ